MPESTVTVGRISYINVAPVYYAIDSGLKPKWLKLVSAPPSVLNKMLSKGELDISPVSSVAYAEHKDEWLLLPNLSISCSGEVKSVILASKKPFNELNNKKVALTDDSASAAKLIKLFFAQQNIKPVFEKCPIKNFAQIHKNTDTILVIGDAAIKKKWSEFFDFVWDLGKMWKEKYDLPFVFSVWAVRKSFAEKKPQTVSSITDLFHYSKKEGLKKIKQIAASSSEKLGIDINTCIEYYEKLSYDLGPSQINGLNVFFDALFQEKIFHNKISLHFFQKNS